MHREIKQNLEEYLKGEGFLKRSDSKLPAEFYSHLQNCEPCAAELERIGRQSQLLRSLRSAREVEPRAGFYARVLERIEAQPVSIWSVFLDRKFGFRLAVASAAMVALLGSYLVLSEPGGREFSSSPSIVYTDPPRTAETGVQAKGSRADQPESDQQDGLWQEQQRDAVLVNLASYRP